MLKFHEARKIVYERAEKRRDLCPSELQNMPLFSAQGQILAETVQSPEAIPGFDNSAMDGYAVSAALTQRVRHDLPLALPILGTLGAGDAARQFAGEGAVEIMTGAPIPEGAFDAVIRIEDTLKLTAENCVQIQKPVAVGENIRRRGSDFALNQRLAKKGQMVTAELMMGAASLGLDTLPVRAPIRVALLITGRELSRFTDKDLAPGMIRDASGPFLQASLNRPDFDLIAHKMLIDDPTLFRNEALKVLELQPDIIISTGAVSMGKYDFISDCLLAMGADLHFHKVAMRPGKPLLFAEWRNGPVWFGLPGNPISTVVGWRFFVEPYVRTLRYQDPEPMLSAILQHSYKKPKGFTCFLKAHARICDGTYQLVILEGQGSYMLSPLLEANCWAVLEAETEFFEEASVLGFYPLSTLN